MLKYFKYQLYQQDILLIIVLSPKAEGFAPLIQLLIKQLNLVVINLFIHVLTSVPRRHRAEGGVGGTGPFLSALGEWACVFSHCPFPFTDG